MLVKPPPAA